jgi:DNA transformation protein and related proteins
MHTRNKISNSFNLYIADLLEKYGDIKIKSMFGGFGVFMDGKIIAIIADEELYFKSAKDNFIFRKEFGAEQFTYQAKGKTVKMNYFKAPSEIFDDPDILQRWVNISKE